MNCQFAGAAIDLAPGAEVRGLQKFIGPTGIADAGHFGSAAGTAGQGDYSYDLVGIVGQCPAAQPFRL